MKKKNNKGKRKEKKRLGDEDSFLYSSLVFMHIFYSVCAHLLCVLIS